MCLSQAAKLVFGPGFSTDSGARLSVEHTHNRLPGLGWRAVSKLLLDRETKLLDTEWTDLPDNNGWRWFAKGQVLREATGDFTVNSGRLRSGRSKTTSRSTATTFCNTTTPTARGGAPRARP